MQPTEPSAGPYPPAPKRLPPRKVPWPWALAVALVALALGVVGTLAVQKLTGHHAGAAQTFTVAGRLHLTDGDTLLNGCRGTGGYADIEAGAQVVVYDNAGKSLAAGELGPGAEDATGCLYPFTVTGVPVGGGGPYSVEITHRGKIVFTRTQAGYLQMSLG